MDDYQLTKLYTYMYRIILQRPWKRYVPAKRAKAKIQTEAIPLPEAVCHHQKIHMYYF